MLRRSRTPASSGLEVCETPLTQPEQSAASPKTGLLVAGDVAKNVMGN
jgi:hypothetical protein